jgi:cobalt-zinc-cadmium efflux system membrane fusion protein
MKSIYKLLSFIVFAIIIQGCNQTIDKKETIIATEAEHSNVAKLTPEQYKTAQIKIGSIEMKALSGTIKVNGMLDLPPQSLVSISTPFEGIVKSTEMLQGLKVKKGQAVVVLQHPDFVQIQQDYLDFKSSLEYLKLEYERQQELATENVNAKKSVQKAKSEYQSMKARVLGLKIKLNLMNVNIANLEKGNIQSTLTLYSPISGYVTEVNTNIGATASPADILFKIADTEHLHAELTVFEKDIPQLKIGQKVRFTLANENKERMATVYLIGREISKERTVNIHCHLDVEDGQLLPGMYLQALVENGSQKVPALPEKAIVEFEGSKYIFIEGKQKDEELRHFEMIEIIVGVTELGFTQVSAVNNIDLSKERIVLNGAYDLLSEIKNSEEGEDH